MAGVGEDGQRAGGQTDHDLHDEEGDDQDERPAESGLVARPGPGEASVVVPVGVPPGLGAGVAVAIVAVGAVLRVAGVVAFVARPTRRPGRGMPSPGLTTPPILRARRAPAIAGRDPARNP